MARVVVTRHLAGNALDRIAAAGHELIVREDSGPASPAELRELSADADALICMLSDRIDAALLDAAPHLKAVAVYAVGTDNVDFSETQRRGVAVGNTPDVLTDATADLALALLLAAARQLPQAARNVREGGWVTWEPTGFLGLELSGARLAIFGAGRIGRATGKRAEAFGMEVELVGRHDDLHAALGRADVVSLHAPLTDATRHVIDAAALAAMKPRGILVNTARGQLVDQDALAAALHSGQLGAAALDVTDPEPLPVDHRLLQAPNLIVLPHIGSATHKARGLMAERAVGNVLATLAGEPMPFAVSS